MTHQESRLSELAGRAPNVEAAGELSAAEIEMIPAADPAPRRKKRPLAEVEAKVTFGGREFDLTFNVYGRVHRAHPGQSGGPGERRVSPPEPAHLEVDAISISNRHYEVEIDAGLSEEMIDALAAAAFEALGE